MRFLLYGPLSPPVADAVRRHGHQAFDLPSEEIAPDAEPLELIAAAHRKQLDIITASPALHEMLLESPAKFDRCIVYLQLAGGDVEQDDAIDRLFARYPRLSARRLYTVTESRVKVRQLPAV